MCHVGNPWMIDAAEVIYKNMNVWADLSGLMVGNDGDVRIGRRPRGGRGSGPRASSGRSATRSGPTAFVYGTDWPLAPMPPYRNFVRDAMPPEYHDAIFEENARVLFRV